LNVARFYEVDPEAVGMWTNRDFLDRQEYMMFQQDLDRQEIEKAERKAKNGR
jgi:hypothetical protein